MGGVGFVELTSTVFWPVLEDGKVLTEEFLEASRVILKFFDILGKLYTPVRSDIDGNIMKLNTRYIEDREKYKYINNMIKEEVEKEEKFAIDALLWLKRGLHFVYLFLQSLVEDYEKNTENESLLEILTQSYELSLRQYHNWGLQKLYWILSRAAPTRNNLLKTMAATGSSEIKHDDMIALMKVYVNGLRTNLESIFDLYIKLKLDDYHFVNFVTIA